MKFHRNLYEKRKTELLCIAVGTPALLMSLFLPLLFRGLFASHYTETHYAVDGSVVTSAAHNQSVSHVLCKTKHFISGMSFFFVRFC